MKNTTIKKGWIRGSIPAFDLYNKINIKEDETIELAKDGAATAWAYFGKKLYFTQALVFGASISSQYHHIACILPSQYGKSFVMAMVDVYLAFMGEKVNIGSRTAENNVSTKIPELMLNADDEIKELATVPQDQFEKLNQKLAKDGLGFSNGGEVRSFSFGSSFRQITGNQAIGLEGNFLTVDESAMIGEEFDEAFSRVMKKSERTGRRGTVVEISNPHKGGRFEKFMTQKNYEDDELVIWMDDRVLIAEGAETRDGLKKRYNDFDSRIYRVNIMGEFIRNEGIIYNDWNKIEILPKDAELLCYGLDFGYGHPTALISVWRDELGYLFREELYQVKLEPNQIVQRVGDVINRVGDAPVVCDTARPEIIASMKLEHIRAVDADKSKGSVLRGIGELQDLKNIRYIGKSIEHESELYSWSDTKQDEPVKANDDAMDAIRYAVDYLLRLDRVNAEVERDLAEYGDNSDIDEYGEIYGY